MQSIIIITRFKRSYEIKLTDRLQHCIIPKAPWIAFMSIFHFTWSNWTSRTPSPISIKIVVPRVDSCARKSNESPSMTRLHPLLTLYCHLPNMQSTNIFSKRHLCNLLEMLHKLIASSLHDFNQFVCLEERHLSGWSSGSAELLNPGLVEFLGWLLLRSLPFKDASARATASRSKTDGGSQIKHLASSSLQMYPCAKKNG